MTGDAARRVVRRRRALPARAHRLPAAQRALGELQRLLVAGLLIVLVPVAWQLPAIVALGVVAVVMVGLIVDEARRYSQLRDDLRHAAG